MKKFLTIGLGNFGFQLAKTLENNGCEVLGIDISKKEAEKVKDYISQVVIGDATNKDTLLSLKIRDFDGVIISIGQDMAPSILISMYLKEIGIEKIIVRAVSDDHSRVLKMLGISDVIFPETDIAVRLGNKLSMKNALDYLPLSEEYGIVEVIPPKSFIGKSLKELEISSVYNCQVIAIRFISQKIENNTDNNDFIKIPPSGNDIVKKNSALIIIGKLTDIEKIEKLK